MTDVTDPETGPAPESGRTAPTARALRALELLQARPGTTAAQLAKRLGVTERAARRYVAILREAGVPVTSVRGPYGGYRLGRGTRLPPVSFTQAEALVLVMAVLEGDPAGTGSDGPVGAALGKVVRALPEGVRERAASLHAHVAATPDRTRPRTDPHLASRLVAAAAAAERVRLGRRDPATGGLRESVVDPWAVVVRYGRWYLLGHSHHADAVRTWRIDRLVSVDTTGETFVPPADLDPVAALAEHLASGWELPTRVLIDAPLDEVRPWVSSHLGRLEEHGTGTLLVGTTRNPQAYAAEGLARVPFPFRVVEGPRLREAVAEVADRLAAAVREEA
ncbi:helix-turn-helix transcriptional regulator [Nocardioides solisilvae]|uniref:helix-turn-helix transcriptional regulator n=1 Tax=Nocardioides solisilvae TaxID=1542435 RepID=UPI000D749863|nr:WYL domain-containing protein [Nocardioides solisilvae]